MKLTLIQSGESHTKVNELVIWVGKRQMYYFIIVPKFTLWNKNLVLTSEDFANIEITHFRKKEFT